MNVAMMEPPKVADILRIVGAPKPMPIPIPEMGPQPASAEYLQRRVKALEEEMTMLYKRETDLHVKIMTQAIALGNHERRQVQLLNALRLSPPLVRRDQILTWMQAPRSAVAAEASPAIKPFTSNERWQEMSL